MKKVSLFLTLDFNIPEESCFGISIDNIMSARGVSIKHVHSNAEFAWQITNMSHIFFNNCDKKM